jgi:hypothetical protein
VAARIGLDSDDKIMVVQNKNPFGSFKNAEPFKLLNLELERFSCSGLSKSNIEKKYAKYLPDFTKKEFESFLLSEDHID